MTEGPQRYRLLRRIGVGGMAEVFRAELVSAEGITRELVVKRIHPRLALDADAVRRFVDEARVAARLRHPHVVQVYEFGREGEHHFLAMELVEGCDLAALIRRGDGGRLPPAVALAVADPLLDALAYVHALRSPVGEPLGLVHRDVSPHNVLLGHAGEVKLADFGIAQASRADRSADGARAVEGKLAYMAPEQARGEEVDARADLFSAAAIVREMLVGVRAYGDATGDPLRVRATVGLVEPSPTDPILAPLLAVLDRALASKREDRPGSAGELREALRSAAHSIGVRADDDALRALVATTVAAEPVVAPSERTLTDAAPSTEAPSEAPPAPPAAPTPPRRRRVFLERAAIAVGVLVVSVLAERRTRPVARTVNPPRAVVMRGSPLRVGLPTGIGVAWWQSPVRRRLEEAVGVRVERVDLDGPTAAARALRAGEVDVALVGSEALRALVTVDAVRRLDTLLPEVDGPGYLAMRAGLRPDSLRWGASVGREGEGTYALPVAVDLVAFGVRDEALRRADDCLATRRPELDAWLRTRRLHLPAGAGPRRDLDAWTSWDLVAAAWCWSRDGGRVSFAPPTDAAGITAVLARWGSLGVPIDGTLPSAEALAPAREAGALLSTAHATSEGDEGVVARWAPMSWWISRGTEHWTLGRPPRGDRLELDAMGDPTEEGGRAVVGRTWGWCLGHGSSRPARAARLALALAEGPDAEPIARELGGIGAVAGTATPTGSAGAFARVALDQAPFVRLEGPAAPEEVDALPERVRSLLGAAR